MIRSILDLISNVYLSAKRYLRRIVGQIQEQSDTFQTSILLEIPGEETSSFQVDTHSSENNREILFVSIMCTLIRDTLLLHQTGLSTNLSSDFVMRETGSGENGNLLSTGNRVHRIDSRDTGGDHFFGVDLYISAFMYTSGGGIDPPVSKD
jgi:hypothetical protein